MIDEKNRAKHGFLLNHREFIKEIDSEACIFTHEKTKAKLIAIKNRDSNKTFAISFRTICSNSTGVPHILEHSVLSGSRKYPLKDVFSEVAKGGLNTFLNAFTALDSTMYPFSTRNEKEYFNIMDIYLDSVLNPLLTKNTFMREGWYYDIKDSRDPLKLNGIVYNEMKGAFSDPYEILSISMIRSLMPGSSYSYNTGGDPLEIPDLTYEQFVDYHRKYYHPSNSIIYVYGNADLDRELGFIDSFLSDFEYNSNGIEIKLGNLIEKPVFFEDSYSVDENTSTREKTFIKMGSVVGNISDIEKNIAFSLLSSLLHDSNASPLKEAILKSGICNDFGGYHSTSFYNTAFITTISGSEKEHRDTFLDIYRDTLEGIVKKGFDRAFKQSEINRFEFELRKKNSTSLRGLEYGFYLLAPIIHNLDRPFDFLKLAPFLEGLKAKVLEENLLEQYVEKYLINNPRTAVLTLVPDPEKAERINRELELRLEKAKKSLSEKEMQNLIKEAEELIAESSTNVTDKELSIIPKLTVDDIEKDIKFHEVQESTIGNIPLIISDIFTNGIIYVELGFRTDSLTPDELNILSLFGKALTDLGTKKKSHEELSILKAEYTGNVSTYFDIISETGNPDCLKPYFWLKFSTTASYIEQALELISDILSGNDFDDMDRIKDIIDKIFIRTEQDILSEGDEFASLRLKAYLGRKGQIAEAVYGYSSFEKLKKIRENYSEIKESLRERFLSIKKKLINQENLLVNIISEEKNTGLLLNKAGMLIDSTGTGVFGRNSLEFDALKPDEAFLTPAGVVFAYAGGNLFSAGIEYSGSLEVLAKYIARDYLYKHIRLIGGAYGSRFHIDSTTGDFILGSYRDPNVKKTYQAYQNLPDDLENLDIGQELFLQFIIGAYSNFDPLLNPDTRGIVARNEFLAKKDAVYKHKIIEEILSTKQKDLVELSPYLRKALQNSYKCIIGSSSLIQADRELFSRLITV